MSTTTEKPLVLHLWDTRPTVAELLERMKQASLQERILLFLHYIDNVCSGSKDRIELDKLDAETNKMIRELTQPTKDVSLEIAEHGFVGHMLASRTYNPPTDEEFEAKVRKANLSPNAEYVAREYRSAFEYRKQNPAVPQ